VEFSRQEDGPVDPPPGGRCQDFSQDCEPIDNYDVFDYTITTGEALVDILFVDDNSGSMYPEQSAIGDKFPNFISSLGSLDYRIAITTTDISSVSNPPRAVNQNGKLQDGRLIEFAAGLNFLTKTTPNVNSLFLNTIKRAETLACEQSGFNPDMCPSADERGIYAAWEAINRNESSFIRPTAHLAVVIIADENERSVDSYTRNSSGSDFWNTYYPIESKDRPETLVGLVNSLYYNSKTFGVHSIVVNDNACQSAQSNQHGVSAFFGDAYITLANITGGHVGSICSSNYGTELGQIGSAIVDRVASLKVACRPRNDSVTVTFQPQPNPGIGVTLDPIKKEIHFSRLVPPATKVRLQYECLAK
jgi:hypothetical protein